MKKIKLLLLAMIISGVSFAQKSFIFLELNPDIPVNVYLNGKKQELKNNSFLMLNNALAGINKLEVESQNKTTEKHTFEINGNEKGHAYKLKKVGSEFKLEDKTSGKIYANNNKINNDVVFEKSNVKNIDQKPFKKEIAKVEKRPDYIVEEYTSEPKIKNNTEEIKKEKIVKNVKAPIVNTTPPVQPGRTYAMYERRRLEQAAINNRVVVEKNYRKINKEKKENIKKENATKNKIETTYSENQKEAAPNSQKKEVVEKIREPQNYDNREVEIKKEKTNAKKERAKKEAEEYIEEKKVIKKEKLPVYESTIEENDANKRLAIENAEREKRLRIEARRKEEEAKELAKLEAKKIRKREQLEAKAARYERKELNKSDIDLQVNESKKQLSTIKSEIIEAEPIDDKNLETYTTKEPENYISERCRRIVGDQEFDQTLETFKSKVDDEAKINYFKRKITSECYLTDQIVTLSKEIETQTGRYKFIEAMKENIADIENVRKFRDLFSYKSYRKKVVSLFE